MIRSRIYDALILGLTSKWYATVLDRLPHGVSMLDVGIGTGGALAANADLVREKQIQITGVDIDADYIRHAKVKLANAGLKEHVSAQLESVYDHQGGPYDAVYFSASFMLLPDPEAALRHCTSLLNPDGRLYFTQTIQTRRSPVMEWFKPLLRRLISIDFGRVTYEEGFKAEIEAGGLALEEFTTMARRGTQAYCLAVAKPAEG